MFIKQEMPNRDKGQKGNAEKNVGDNLG